MKIAIVDACGYETGDITGKIEVYELGEELADKYKKSNNTVQFYKNNLKEETPVEVRSNDLEGIITV